MQQNGNGQSRPGTDADRDDHLPTWPRRPSYGGGAAARLHGMAPPVLLVESDPATFELMHRALSESRLPNPVQVARDADEARRCVAGWRDGSPPPRMILVDLADNESASLEILQEIRRDPVGRTLPVVMVGEPDADVEVRAAYAKGANSFIPRPALRETLATAAQVVVSYWCGLNLATVDAIQ